MRLSPWLTTLTALVCAALLLAGAWWVLNPGGPPLQSASFSLATITPNADGHTDATRIRYTLRRPATISIYFVDANGGRFEFRQDKARDAGEHTVDFSGIVAPYLRPGEAFEGEVLARVLPNGTYQWVITARDAAGEQNSIDGALTIAEADTTLPELRGLAVGSSFFTPNQDGLNDRATINVYLTKEVNPESLRVFLVGPDGSALPIGELGGDILPGQRGLHTYDYDGGIDLGANPPPDGQYTVRAEVEDRLGQKLATETRLTIERGGLPRADIVNATVDFSATTLRLGETLFFTLTVENYGVSPIRTSGPPAGYVYKSMAENANTLGEFEQSGAWRVGIDCDTCIRDYPWRWALGTPETLTALEENGQTHYYLMPGQRATISGGIVLDKITESRNPQYFWAGLIHEDVEVAPVNNFVDAHFITVVANQ
jgi:hypothetical protein